MAERDKKLEDLLAAEYALGVLDGPVCRRIRKRMASDPKFAAAVGQWQNRLAVLALDLAPVEPPAHLWPAIERQLNTELRSDPTFRKVPRAHPRAASGWWNSLGFWRGFGVASAAAAAALAALLLTSPVRWQAPAEPGRALAVLADPSAQAHWLVRARGSDGLILEAIDHPSPTQGHVFQLWAVPSGGAPRSLGVLANADRGIVQVNLPAKLDDMLAGAAALAISEEGPGGSATGAPNLPPRYVGTLLKP